MHFNRQLSLTLALAIFAAGSCFGEEPSSNQSQPSAPAANIFHLVDFHWLNRSQLQGTSQFGITLDPGALQASAEKPLVILVHGYHSSPERLAPLAMTIRSAGYPCGALRYPNDQPVADSAALLSQELRRLAQEQPGRKIVLVTHSMGGLVARQVIETPSLNPGNVSQLMMIAPPNHGTTCAYISLTSDLWEHGDDISHRTALDCLFATGKAATGEARNDLKPHSALLTQLNAEPLNPAVHYTVFLGTGALLTPAELTYAQQFVWLLAHVDRFIGAMQPIAERILFDFDDAAAPGDGVVSLASGRLPGVADTVLLGFDHWNVIGPPRIQGVAELHRQILNRLSGELLARTPNAAP